MNASDIIQTAAVLAAVGAAIVALVISAFDRKNARNIAAEDRRVGLQQAKLNFELTNLLRLLENNNRGGSTDALEVSRLGAEALTLIGTIGKDRLPRQWARRVKHEDDGLRLRLESPDTPEFIKSAIETQLALNVVVRELNELIDSTKVDE